MAQKEGISSKEPKKVNLLCMHNKNFIPSNSLSENVCGEKKQLTTTLKQPGMP
jgi:hypothetical protein